MGGYVRHDAGAGAEAPLEVATPKAGRERLYREDLAELAGLKGPDSLPPRTPRRRGSAWVLPDPDGVEIVGGHARPWWAYATGMEWVRSRPGSGRWGDR